MSRLDYFETKRKALETKLKDIEQQLEDYNRERQEFFKEVVLELDVPRVGDVVTHSNIDYLIESIPKLSNLTVGVGSEYSTYKGVTRKKNGSWGKKKYNIPMGSLESLNVPWWVHYAYFPTQDQLAKSLKSSHYC